MITVLTFSPLHSVHKDPFKLRATHKFLYPTLHPPLLHMKVLEVSVNQLCQTCGPHSHKVRPLNF
ncbi:hypothetical protein B7P43_G11707 [Cryptotermes secundus]|uniref:Uncharacterized protein n=1 Tax=Cryptotermes secundus TaxID=105785 RepID=A0A2J7PRW1_9NEOP|nr:hypothetical protein B7P43_G11707 [Cryptotermes secundus]